jgi:transcription antitermination protein NusB
MRTGVVMSRRELREQIFKLLFRVEFNSAEEMPEQERLFFDDEEAAKEKDAEYVSEKYQKIQEKLPQIDEMINEKAEKWDTARMSKVDLTILRLAVYEIMFDESVPTGVAINEAVELAKKFGQDASFSFVNGILAKFA